MTRTRAPEARRFAEEGFTLLEMIITVMIIGIVFTPLSLALNQELRTIPESSGRTQFATDNDAFVLAWSNDVAQAQGFNNLLASGASMNNSTSVPSAGCAASSPGCWWDTRTEAAVATGTINCTATAGKLFAWFGWNPNYPTAGLDSYAYYQIVIAGSSLQKVSIQRSADAGATWTTLTGGYCQTGDTNIVQLTTTPPVNPDTVTQAPANGYDGESTISLDLRNPNGDKFGAQTFTAKMRVANT